MSAPSRLRPVHLVPGLLPPLALALAWGLGASDRLIPSAATDPFEPNDALAAAAPLELGPAGRKLVGLQCRGGDVDWFRVHVPSGKALRVSTDPLPGARGATTIHDLRGVTLGATADDEKVCRYAPCDPQGEDVLVRVWGERAGGYDLDLQLTDPRARFEPNDLPDQAPLLELGHGAGLTCNGSDWFRVLVPARRGLVASVVGAPGGVAIRAADPSASSIASTGSAAYAARIEVPAAPMLRALLLHAQGSGDYGLDLELTDVVASDTPPELPEVHGTLEPNDTRETAARLTAGRYPDLECDGADWYAVDVPAGANLSLDLSDSSLAVSVYTGLERKRLQSGQRAPDGVHLRRYAKRAESLLLRVSGPKHRAYELTLRLDEGLPGTPLAPGEYPELALDATQPLRMPQLQAGQVLRVEAWSQGDSGLSLTFTDVGGSPLGPASNCGQRVTLTHEAAEDSVVLLRANGVQGERFGLKVTVDGGAAAGVAAYRPPGARPLAAGIYPARTLTGQDAYYALALRRGQVLEASVRFKHAEADLDLELLDASGRPLATSARAVDVEQVRTTAEDDAPVFLHVFSYEPSDGLRYDLRVEVDGRSWPEALPLPEGEAIDVGGLRADGVGAWRFEVEPGERARVALRGGSPADREALLVLKDEDGTELATAPVVNGEAELEHVTVRGGELLVEVRGQLGFGLSVARSAP